MRIPRRRFERLVTEALDAIPAPLAERIENVEVLLEDWPTEEQLDSVGLEPDDTLFGLYEGTPLLERGITSDPLLPDRIIIFQGPIEDACGTDDEVREEIRRTVVHEVAHYFGFDEDALDTLGYG